MHKNPVFFVLLSLVAVFAFAGSFASAQTNANLLTCFKNTNESAVATNAADLFSFGNASIHALAVNSAGTYVFVLFNTTILRYQITATGFNRSSAIKFGRTKYVNGTCVIKRKAVCNPFSLKVDARDRLWVADHELKRVLRFDNVSNPHPTRKQTRPRQIIGAAAWKQDRRSASNYSALLLAGPWDIAYDNDSDTLYVLDRLPSSTASRVLRYDSISTQRKFYVAPSVVFGQENFTVFEVASTSSKTFSGAETLEVDSDGNLYVVDTGNNRILRFDAAASLDNFAKANHWIGQSTSSGNNATTSQKGLRAPAAITFDATNDLAIISDRGNNRVVIYDDATDHTSNPTFDIVIGQDTWTGNLENQNQTKPGPRTLSFPYSAAYVPATGALYIADSGNERALAYGPCVGATNSPVVSSSVSPANTHTSSLTPDVTPSAESTPGVSSTTGGSTGSSSTTGN